MSKMCKDITTEYFSCHRSTGGYLLFAQKKTRKEIIEWLKDHKDDNVSIIEIGCGTSEHSLRDESELLIANVLKNGHLIPIDPGKCMTPEGHVGLNVGFKMHLFKFVKEKAKTKMHKYIC